MLPINNFDSNEFLTRNLTNKAEELSKGKPENKVEMAKAAKEFEQMFMSYVMETVRKTMGKNPLFDGGAGEEIFTQMLDEQYAKELGESGGLGIAELILKQQLQGGVIQKTPKMFAPKSCMPVNGEISSNYGMRHHPVLGCERFHHGLDIAAKEGTPVRAFKDGEVIFSGEMGEYGNIVIVQHPDKTESRYAHNSANLVNIGDKVSKGQEIAKVGSTGLTTGPHLHFEIRKDGESVNPKKYL